MRDLQKHLRTEMTFTVVYKTGALIALDDIYAVDDYFSSLLSPGGFRCVDTRMHYGIRVLTLNEESERMGKHDQFIDQLTSKEVTK